MSAPVRFNSPRDILIRCQEAGAGRTLERIAEKWGVTPLDVVGRRRTLSTARARREFTAILRHTLALSYPELGELLGRDHTSVMAACRSYDSELRRQHDGRAA